MYNLSNLPVESKLQIDVETFAGQLEFELAPFILPSPKGIYISTKLEPVMVDGKIYYHGNPNTLPNLVVTDINEVKTNIFNSDYKIIIPKQFLENKEKYISNQSLLPYRGLKIIEAVVRDEVTSTLRYLNRGHCLMTKVQQHLIEIENDQKFDEIHTNIINICSGLIQDLGKFVGKDDWHMYTIKLLNRVICVEKHIDYRIYEWHQQNDKKESID